MSATPELDISLLTHSSVSIPSSLGSQSTAVSIKHTTSYSELRDDDDDFQASIAKFDSVSTIKPTFNVTPALEPSDSQASLLDRHVSTPSEHSTWLRRTFQQRQRQQVTANGNSWQPSFRRTGPLLGLTALGFILLTIPASALVLALSNGKPVDQWRVQPSVYISVLTGIGNKALGFASIQGAIITWWRKAVRGTTLQGLHDDWPIGNGKHDLFSRKHLSMLTVTSICACVIFLDGILLQSATYTVEQNLQKPVMLRAELSPEIPTNYTATGALLDAGNPYLNADFSSGIEPVRKQWTDGLPIPSPLRRCEGICTAKVRAPALVSAGCQEESNSWLNFTEIKEIRDMATLPSGCQQRWNNIRCQMFELQVYPSAAAGAWERVEISYGRFMPIGDVNQGQCAGNLTYTTCSFRSAIAEYDVTTYNNTAVTINAATPRILDVANNTARQPYLLNQQINTTIGGVALLGSKDFYSDIGMWSPGTHVQYTDNINRVQSRLISNANDFFSKKACAPIFEDPVPEVLTVLNKLMFSSSVYATQELEKQDLFARIDPGLQISYDVQGLRIDAQPVFHTKWVFFWGAAAIQILCVVVVLSTFWDYWKLGRAVSLSPLEIARAFDADLVKREDCTHSEGWRLAEMQDIGERRVRYGLGGKNGRLGFGDINTVRRPDRGNTFAG